MLRATGPGLRIAIVKRLVPAILDATRVVLVTTVFVIGGAPEVACAEDERLPDAETLIRDLGLVVSPTPSRDLPGSRAPRKVLVWVRTPDLVGVLKSAAPNVEIVPVDNAEEAAEQAADAHAIIGFSAADVM